MDIHDLLAERPLGSHVYVCGPDGMIEQTIERAHDLGWTNSHIHFERFVEQGSTGQPFSVTLARQGEPYRLSRRPVSLSQAALFA